MRLKDCEQPPQASPGRYHFRWGEWIAEQDAETKNIPTMYWTQTTLQRSAGRCRSQVLPVQLPLLPTWQVVVRISNSGPGVKEAGGFGHHRYRTSWKPSPVDRQLRGRAGRQGDLGSSSFFVSLEDDLMRMFGSERIASPHGPYGLQRRWSDPAQHDHKEYWKSAEESRRKQLWHP